ncbi:hypothetical protein HMPREF9695_04416 [Afipia broomeae ATCC 49717]|uniref:Uncharacterized protein n=1 Tax=Afipia broomeae ATCC 49717 TaxID=883078 RepID=K8NZ69_9BRAD|nr:hypothetical protein HMPREF9695_04416 [Afipia broomeae ATCC 49717]
MVRWEVCFAAKRADSAPSLVRIERCDGVGAARPGPPAPRSESAGFEGLRAERASLDKADDLASLILFYDTGDLSLLAEVVADGYVAAAPSYAAAVAVGRQPRSAELGERQGIERATRSLLRQRSNGSNSVDEEVSRRFPHVSAEDKASLAESIDGALKALNEVTPPLGRWRRRSLQSTPKSGPLRSNRTPDLVAEPHHEFERGRS